MVLDEAWNETTQLHGHAGVRPQHILAISCGVANFLLNSVIWIAFVRAPNLLAKSHLHLFFAFAVTNTLSGFFTIPTYVNLFLHNNLNCPRWTIMIGSVFEIGLDRIRTLLALGIAFERAYALYRPGDFYMADGRTTTRRIVGISILWAVFDAVSMAIEDNLFVIRVHCVTTASSGRIFHTYFLVSAIIAGFVLTFVYVAFLVKLFIVRDNTVSTHKSCSSLRETFNQANSLAVLVILCVMLFSVLPSSLYFHDLLVNKVYFMEYGPVITVGYHLYGISSFFCYSLRHREISSAVRRCCVDTTSRDSTVTRETSFKRQNKLQGCDAQAVELI